jgi:hypothetical protein
MMKAKDVDADSEDEEEDYYKIMLLLQQLLHDDRPETDKPRGWGLYRPRNRRQTRRGVDLWSPPGEGYRASFVIAKFMGTAMFLTTIEGKL